MGINKDQDELRLLSKVGTLYYLRELTQQQIARRLHLSRPKVSRLLQRARDEGIVQISIISPDGAHVHLESEIERRYGLEEVVIVDADLEEMSPEIRKHHLGAAAATYLQRTLSAGDVIGITWGTTLQAMVQSVQPATPDDIHVVQTLGGVGPPEAKIHAANLSRRLARLLGGTPTLLPAPAITSNVDSRAALLSDAHVRAAVSMFSRLTTAYVGIGALETGALEAEDVEELRRSGAIGDIALRFFDAEGNPVHTSLDERLIGITLEALKRVERLVGVAGGPVKAGAIRAALRGGYIDVLITDSETAPHLLAEG